MSSKLKDAVVDSVDERRFVAPGGAVFDRRIGQTRLTAELAGAIVMHDGYRIRHVESRVTRSELPHEMVAHFHHLARSDDVLGADAIWVQFYIASRFLLQSVFFF